jgi:hypothetical protein
MATYDAISLALDRSARSIDKYGRLHVAVSNISKSNVCPYRGDEIPGYQALGLDPARVYKMLRDPAELTHGAATFNNLPLLSAHRPVTADQPQKQIIVGSLGTDATFTPPYLRNSLVVWDSEAIELIDSDEKKELSAAYGYDPDMTPGIFQGVRYDGVMRNIVGNHVSLVEAGRAGSDVVVGDSEFLERNVMTMPRKPGLLSRKAAMVAGALGVYLQPKLAADAKIDLRPVLAGTTAKNWKARKKTLPSAIATAVKGQLAQDADLADLMELLDKLDGNGSVNRDDEEMYPDDDVAIDEPQPAEGEPPDADQPPPDPAPAEAAPVDPAADPVTKALAFLKDLIRPEDIAMVAHILQPPAPPPAEKPPPAEGEPPMMPPTAKDSPPPTPGTPKPPGENVTKTAMDAALARVRTETEAAVVARFAGIREAEAFVRPWVGALAIAQDSAEGVYRAALETLGVGDLDEVHPTALKHIIAAQPKPGEVTRPARKIAMDASAGKGFAERFPIAAARH